MKITFNENVRKDNQHRINEYLQRFKWLVPGWVQTMHCNLWDGKKPGERISVTVNYDYRSVCLNFASGWLDEPDDEQAKQVLHEFLHIHLALIANFARETINLLCPASEDPKFNASLHSTLINRHESATCDLTHVLWNRLLK